MKYIKNYLESKKNDKPNMKKLDIDGFVVYQGRDADANDHITLELSDENDIWMHAKGVPGSHILIKIKDFIPTETTLKKAAIIAAKNSKSQDERVKVVYCKKKFVKKKPGMKPGQVEVDYTNSEEIIVNKN